MNPNRRQYRVQQSRQFFTVSLRGSDEEAAEGLVVDLSARGVACLFEAAEVAAQRAGAAVALDLQAPLLMFPIRAEGLVRHVGTEDGVTQLGIEFVDHERVMEQVPYALLREFNRRAAHRVDVEEPVEVVARRLGREACVRGQLLDVSTGGLCMRLDEASVTPLEGREAWEVRFRLPGGTHELALVGSLCALRSEPDRMDASVEFRAEASTRYEEQRAELERFVAARRVDRAAERAPEREAR